MTVRHTSTGLLIAAWIVATVAVGLQEPARAADSVVRYTPEGELIKPADFREWVFLGSGLGMTYTAPDARAASSTRPPAFTNVYVNPSSYREFVKSGTWPDQTMLILEIRASASEGSINLGGRYQTGLLAVEANVKDSSKPTAWTFYNFGGTADRAKALPTTADCYNCHGTKAAVDNTFVQFYPTLLDIAKQKGTVKAGH